jgi:HD-like signal output (HDOD) protein
VDDLAKVIEKDAVISVKLIFTANSPFYRGTENIKTVGKAISRLGFKETQGIVSAIANKGLYNTKNENMNMLMEELWLHSLACAYGSREIGKAIGFDDPESLFLMGLVHDIGKVLLLKTFGDRSSNGDMSELTEVAGIVQDVHTSFGGALLKRWGFADTFIKIAAKHEGPEFNSDTEKELLIVNLANNLTRKIGYSLLDEEVDLLGLDSAKHLHIEQNALDKVEEEVKKQVQSSGDMFN